PNLYVYDFASGAPKKLTESLNPEIATEDLAESEIVRFKSFDGMTIPNILYRPHGATATNPAPALVWVHGGPGGQTRTVTVRSCSSSSIMVTLCWGSTTEGAVVMEKRFSLQTIASTGANRFGTA